MKYGAVFVAVCALALSACTATGGDDPDSPDPGVGGLGTQPANEAVFEADVDDSEPVAIAFFIGGAQNEFYAAVDDAVAAAAGARNATVTTFDAAFDPQTQYRQIQDATASNQFDAFIITPVNGISVVPAITEAADAGITVICATFACGDDFASSVPTAEGVVAQVAPAQLDNGKRMGQLAVEACADQDPCQVAYIGGFTNPQEEAIFDGFKEVLDAAPQQIDVVARGEGEFLPAPAEVLAQDFIRANPDLDVIATTNDPMGEGALLAAVAAGVEDQVSIVALGGAGRGIEKVLDGEFYGTAPLFPYDDGLYAVDLAVRAVRGQPFETSIDPVTASGLPAVFTLETSEEFGDFAGQYAG